MASNADIPAAYDLHLHTHWSYDATAEPEGYFKRARELGMRCIAITDHHVMDSLEEVLEIAPRYKGIRVIPSAELTVTTSAGNVDLLCYGLRPISKTLAGILDRYHAWQQANGEAISKGMRALNYDFSDAHRLELLQSYRPAKAIRAQGNTHVKEEFLRDYFVKRGFIAKPEDFGNLMKRVRKSVPFPPYPDVAGVVQAVKELGAVIAIAHPFGYFNGYDIRIMDALRRECRLDGIECAHWRTPPEYTIRHRDYCAQNGLFSTGGSDSHSHDNPAFARHGGNDEWLDEFLDRLDSKQ
ncbi:MAG: PHP domain-containing protein [Planctomycetota bacterium]